MLNTMESREDRKRFSFRNKTIYIVIEDDISYLKFVLSTSDDIGFLPDAELKRRTWLRGI